MKWDFSVEYVPIHPDITPPKPFKSYEYWPETGGWLEYRPELQITAHGGTTRHVLTYRKSSHPKLVDLDIDWGQSTIEIADDRKVKAAWKSAVKEAHSGFAPARLIDKAARVRTSARPNARNQSPLRTMLLSTDRACAITGETTASALECAHVVSVGDDGDEVFGNAILLRADLHCLYDSGLFQITPKGKIIKLSSGLSDEYRNLLKGKSLPPEVAERVSMALKDKKAV